MALSVVASQQTDTNEDTIAWISYYDTYQEEAVVTFKARNMVISVVGGQFFMAGYDPVPINNGGVLTVAQIIKAFME